MKTRAKVIVGIVAGLGISGAWAWGNLVAWGDVWRGQEYLGRSVWMHCKQADDADPRHRLTPDELAGPGLSALDTPWCGYRLLVKAGLRLAEAPPASTVAALIPTRAFPRWVVWRTMPPAIVLTADGAAVLTTIDRVPLALR